jgi:CRP-like cAMP-binding protein
MPNFYDLNCTRDAIVFKEGDPASRVYIIKEGEFMITKKLIHKFKEEDNIEDILEDPQRACKLNNKFFKKNAYKQIENHFLSYLYHGKMLGEVDLMTSAAENPKCVYTTTVKCTSQKGSLIYINKDDFLKLQSQSSVWTVL